MTQAATLEDLLRHATDFRSAIERCDRAKLYPGFQEFPHGACGIASLYLGCHLAALGYSVYYCCGWLTGGSTHAWLEVDRFLIDITADQFAQAPVIVTADRTWHSRFSDVERRPVSSSEVETPFDRWIYHHILTVLRGAQGAVADLTLDPKVS